MNKKKGNFRFSLYVGFLKSMKIQTLPSMDTTKKDMMLKPVTDRIEFRIGAGTGTGGGISGAIPETGIKLIISGELELSNKINS